MSTLVEQLDQLPFEAQLTFLMASLKGLAEGKDVTLRALSQHARAVPTQAVIVGGVAVIRHGYRRTTVDRDVLVSFRDVRALADRLMNDPDWERLETAQYAFLYRPTGMKVDFLVSRDLMRLGLPYYFPDVESVLSEDVVEGLSVIDFHELLFLKLIAGRMQDLADVMELCKRHLGDIDADRVIGRLEPEDNEIRAKFLEVLRNAPLELAEERRLGQQDIDDREHRPPEAESVFRQQGHVDLGRNWWQRLLGIYTPATIEVAANELTIEGIRLPRDEITRLQSKRRRSNEGLEITLGRSEDPPTIVFWSTDFAQLKAELERRGWRIGGEE